MYKIIRYFNQNRKKILSIIVVIASSLFLLYYINARIANRYNKMHQNVTTEGTIIKDNINNNSAIDGSYGGANYTKQTDIIEHFIECCNNSQVEEAYNMLSSDCKENMYPTLDYFTKNYYNNNFEKSKSYNIQRWSGSIYKIDLRENILHTGNISGLSKQDFVTLVYEEGEYKLNVNSYIGRTNLNIEKTVEDLYIKVVYKDTYMNYENYIMEVKNNGGADIYLDNLEEASTVYIIDENEVKHVAYLNELSKEQLHIYPYSKTKIQIKFSNAYITGRDYLKIVFENVILNDKNNQGKILSIKLK